MRPTLAPGTSQAFHTRLVIPPDADPGDYAALISPQIVAAGGGGQVGAAAAARLTFTVQGRGARLQRGAPGADIVLATATVDSISIDSEARLLTVTESTRRPC